MSFIKRQGKIITGKIIIEKYQPIGYIFFIVLKISYRVLMIFSYAAGIDTAS